MQNFSVTPLSFEQLSREAGKTGHVYVINYTDMGRKQARGNYYIGIPDRQGKEQSVLIPNTWVPVDMASYVNREDILNSTNFRTAIRNSRLVAISMEEARIILNDPAAAAEVEKVNAQNQSVGANVIGGKLSISTDSHAPQNRPPSASALNEEAVATKGADNRLNSLVQAFNGNTISDADAEQQLSSMTPPPSSEALKNASDAVAMKSSAFYRRVAEMIT